MNNAIWCVTMEDRLIIVSNRLPVTLRRGKDRRIETRQSSGGLVSAILSLPDHSRITWIGAADFKKEIWEEFVKTRDEKGMTLVPVFLDNKIESLYYNGFSNGMVWPLFHYFPTYAEYEESHFNAYRQVNMQFAEVVREVAGANDHIWVHDYHFMLLPGFLRTGGRKLSCSFFLHIPFPSYELVKLIPEDWRNEILNSLLLCDVAGFHTAEYSSHFKRALSFFLGVEPVNSVATINGHSCYVGEFPISIDFEKFNSAYDNPGVVKLRKAMRKRLTDERIIFSIDRLDYSKGVNNRLQAYELLLKSNEALRGKIVFVINVIPSRETISTYRDRKRDIEENVSRINGIYGSVQWQPIIYQYRHLSFSELVACYTVCDVALVTPLRDGMNLVAKEFVATRKDLRGVLILSEFAGASHELMQAIMVNPNDVHLVGEAMLKAIGLSVEEQEKRMRDMQEVIRNNDVRHWAGSFVEKMKNARKPESAIQPNIMSVPEKHEIFDSYRNANRRLILLDYDGTLVQFNKRPEDAVPGDVLKELIGALAGNNKNRLVLISGRDPDTLQKWFHNSRIDIAAEHGSIYRLAGQNVWVYPGEIPMDWKKEARECIQKYTDKISGSFIEEKKYSIAWHYRDIENIDEEATRLALSKELLLLHHKEEFDILHGNKVIEIKSAYTNKGKFISRLLTEENFDFVLAIGDDATDEDMFNVLRDGHHFTIKVGMGTTAAKFSLPGVKNVISFLDQLGGFNEPVA
jgi:trehalose 6-phosphate synthase/phosphatase